MTWSNASTALIAVAAAALVSLACLDWLGPGSPPELALVGAEQGMVAEVSLGVGRVGSWTTRLPPYQNAWARSPDGSTVYWSAFNFVNTPTLLATDAVSLRTLWRDSTTGLEQRSQVGPITVFGDYAISATPDGTHLLVADARQGTTTGIAVLDMTTRNPIAFIGPLLVGEGGMATLAPTSAYPAGAVVVAGSRGTSQQSPGQLFVFDGVTLALRDSVTLMPSVGLYRGAFSQVIASPDQLHVYVVSWSALYEYDVISRQVIASGPRLGSGELAISPDGNRLYLSDAGEYVDFPGSGKVFVYDAALHPLPAFDLSAASVNGILPVRHGLATSHDGTRLYVMSGTGSVGPLYGTQLDRLFVLDTGTGRILSTIALGQYGGGWIILE